MAKKTKKATKYSKGWETRRANAARLGVSPHAFVRMPRKPGKPVFTDAEFKKIAAEAQDINTAQSARHGDNGRTLTDAESHIIALTNDLMSLARSKGGAEKVAAKLRVIQNGARYQGQTEVEKISIERLKAVQERMAERVVCGFLAEVNIAEQTYSGLPIDMVWSMNSLTVRHIVDALNRAGYRPNGRDNHGAAAERREALMGKRHADVNYAQGG